MSQHDHDGNMYVFSKHIRVGEGRIVNPDGCDSVQGCLPHAREPHDIAVQWIAPLQMVQPAPGHKWCATCGDVRPLSYFDVTAYGDDGKPTAYAHECRQCMNGRDPKLRPTKYCSGCKQEKRRAEFYTDERNNDGLRTLCKECFKALERDDYRLEVGRPIRKYERREAVAAHG